MNEHLNKKTRKTEKPHNNPNDDTSNSLPDSSSDRQTTLRLAANKIVLGRCKWISNAYIEIYPDGTIVNIATLDNVEPDSTPFYNGVLLPFRQAEIEMELNTSLLKTVDTLFLGRSSVNSDFVIEKGTRISAITLISADALLTQLKICGNVEIRELFHFDVIGQE